METSPVQQIKDRLDIAEIIKGYIKLKKAGANYTAPCPFHSEKKPSFFVSPARQIWHCFGCGKGGDVFKFVMEIEGVEFGDALRMLAQKAGIELKRQDPKIVTERQRLYEICELTAQFFEKQLQKSKTGEAVKKYLLGRGISEDSISKWRIGYAPEIWRALSDFLVGKAYQREEAIRAGLAIQKENDRTSLNAYDRFRGRIMFPIFDLNSQVVGFTGRIFEQGKTPPEGAGKYVNTPNTMLYDKSRILYGLDKAKFSIRQKDACILVEGQTDAIMCAQAGFDNVVATSGTALTPFQLQILKRYSSNLLTAFDMDIAGDSATKRGIDLAQAQGFNINVVSMLDAKDPADIISKDPKVFENLIGEARSIMEFYFETTFTRFDAERPEGKKEISKVLLPIIKRLPNKIEQSHWIQQLARKLSVSEESVEAELNKTKREMPDIFAEKKGVGIQPQTRKEMLEESVVALILKFPQHLGLANEDALKYFSSRMKEILGIFQKEPIDKENTLDRIIKEQLSSEQRGFLNHLILKAEVEDISEADAETEIKTCLKELEILEVKIRLKDLSWEIKKAEDAKDSKKADALIGEFNQLSQKLNRE